MPPRIPTILLTGSSGGVGVTTIAEILIEQAVAYGWRVLVVPFEGDSNLGLWCRRRRNSSSTVFRVCYQERSLVFLQAHQFTKDYDLIIIDARARSLSNEHLFSKTYH